MTTTPTASPTRVAFVTGASRGIGKAIALRLARDGRHVVLCARSEGPLNELKAQIEAGGGPNGAPGKASVAMADVYSSASITAAIEKVIAEHGQDMPDIRDWKWPH